MSGGLEFLSNLISLSRPQEKVYLMEDQVAGKWPTTLSFGDTSAFLSTALRTYEYSRLQSTLEEARRSADVEFVSDQEESSPNAAWPWSTKLVEHNANFRSGFGNEESFRSWGYVMWDYVRLKVLEVLGKEASTYGEHGPKARYGQLMSDGRGGIEDEEEEVEGRRNLEWLSF